MVIVSIVVLHASVDNIKYSLSLSMKAIRI